MEPMHDIEVDDTCCEKIKKLKVDHDDKDKSDDVVNPTKNPSLQEEGSHFPWCNYICVSGDEDEFDEDYPPIRHVEEFTDDYDLLAPYSLRFPFEDKEDFNYKRLCGRRGSKKAHQTILRYIKQIRESFGFDVDCRPPRWFHIARLKTIKLSWGEGYFKSKSCEKAYKDFVDLVLEAAKDAVEDINYAIGFETSGKGFKFVGLEKGVTSATYCVLFLTINVIEVEVANVTEGEGASRKTIQEDGVEGEGALRKRKIIQADGAGAGAGAGAEGEGASRKTIQAIVSRNSHGIYQVEQWRMKPVLDAVMVI